MSSLDRPTGRVGEQHQAYRRGLVLGLTLAEVGTLVIFVLLLLIGVQALKAKATAEKLDGAVVVSESRLGELEASDKLLKELQTNLEAESFDPQRLKRMANAERALIDLSETLGVSAPEPDDDFRRLIRLVRQIAASAAAKRQLADAADAFAELKVLREQLAATVRQAEDGEMANLVERLQGLHDRVANQEGQITYLQARLREAGGGRGERPCWVQPDGTIDYLFDVVLTSAGIRMRDHVLQHRVEERSRLPLPHVDPANVLSPGGFLAQTADLFRHSEANNCRFFVVVYDDTAAHEKELYKRLLKTVEGHFYKRSSDAAAPF